MRLIFVILSFISFLVLGCETEKRYSPDGKISLNIIGPNKSILDTLTVSENDRYAMIALFNIGDSAKNQNFLFSITRMKGDKAMTIEDAFNNYVRDVTPFFTTVIEAKSYKKDGKMLYRKISESDWGPEKVRNIMFYFMENNNSNILYELKGSIATEKYNYGIECMEKMALSVKIQ